MKAKFVQLAIGLAYDSQGDADRALYALDSSGNVFVHYEHRTKGWGWWRLRGDRQRGEL